MCTFKAKKKLSYGHFNMIDGGPLGWHLSISTLTRMGNKSVEGLPLPLRLLVPIQTPGWSKAQQQSESWPMRSIPNPFYEPPFW